MTYRTILVHLDYSDRCAERIALAASLAVKFGAHLIGIAPTGGSGTVYGEMGNVLSRGSGLVSDAELDHHANEAAARFKVQVATAGLASYEALVVKGEAVGAILSQGRFADLVVIGQTDPEMNVIGLNPDFVADVVEMCPRPVLIVPYAGSFKRFDRHVAIAWDASRVSARAVADAMPLMILAEDVRILTFNMEPEDGMGDSGAAPDELAKYLKRHGVKAQVLHEDSPLDTGNALLSRISDYGSDLIVMGAFGHSRLRQALLGGVTKTILASMTVPVVMSR